jgi:hypothetical protein
MMISTSMVGRPTLKHLSHLEQENTSQAHHRPLLLFENITFAHQWLSTTKEFKRKKKHKMHNQDNDNALGWKPHQCESSIFPYLCSNQMSIHAPPYSKFHSTNFSIHWKHHSYRPYGSVCTKNTNKPITTSLQTWNH